MVHPIEEVFTQHVSLESNVELKKSGFLSLVASMRGAYRVATGQMVRIEGLKNDQKYNGKAGVVLNENCGKPTCVVLLASGDKLLCRKNNLRPMGPTPEDVKGSKKESLEEEDYGLIQVPNSPVTMPSPEGEGEPPAIEKGREEREESGQVAIGSRPTLMRVLERLIPNSYTSELKLNRITPRLLTVGLAAAKGKGVGKKVGEWLRENCGKGRFMVYNLTKSAYDYSNLDFRVVHYPSPVFPTLPANKMLGLCKSISSWLALDAQHVAVLQCRTGRGRSACAAACYLHYSHRFRFPNIERALAHVARVRGIPLRKLINPTQKRFARYFSLLLKRLKRSKSAESKNPGIPKKPNETIPSLRLDRIIINVAPEVEKGGIRPVVQVFSEEKMVYDGISSSFESGQGMETLLNAGSTGKVEIGAQVSGPFLVRLCHLPTQSIAHKPSASAENLDQKKNEINESAPLRAPCLVRVGLDTEFLSTGVERLGVGKVDVAFSAVRRLSPEFFLDLIFSTPPTPPIQQNSNKSYIPSPPSPPPRRSPSKFTNSSPTPLSKPRLEDKSEKTALDTKSGTTDPHPLTDAPASPPPRTSPEALEKALTSLARSVGSPENLRGGESPGIPAEPLIPPGDSELIAGVSPRLVGLSGASEGEDRMVNELLRQIDDALDDDDQEGGGGSSGEVRVGGILGNGGDFDEKDETELLEEMVKRQQRSGE